MREWRGRLSSHAVLSARLYGGTPKVQTPSLTLTGGWTLATLRSHDLQSHESEESTTSPAMGGSWQI